MADNNDDDSAPSTEISSYTDEDDEIFRQEKSDAGSEDGGEIASEYNSDDEDEVVEELTMEEELEITRRSLAEAKKRIVNLLTQVNEYHVCFLSNSIEPHSYLLLKQENYQKRLDLEHKIQLISQEHMKYVIALVYSFQCLTCSTGRLVTK